MKRIINKNYNTFTSSTVISIELEMILSTTYCISEMLDIQRVYTKVVHPGSNIYRPYL